MSRCRYGIVAFGAVDGDLCGKEYGFGSEFAASGEGTREDVLACDVAGMVFVFERAWCVVVRAIVCVR